MGRSRTDRVEALTTVQTGVGQAEVVRSGSRGDMRTLLIDEEIHGQVDLGDPMNLQIDYQARLAAIVATVAPPGEGRIMHLGGGAVAVPRAVAVTNPDLTQTVVERSAAILRLAEKEMGVRRSTTLVLRKGDGRAAIERLPDEAVDVVVADAFIGQDVPHHLTTVEFLTAVRRVLRPNGFYVANIIDQQPWSRLGAHVAGARTVFGQVAALGSRGVARLRDPGNVFLLAAVARIPRAALRHDGAVASHPFAFVPDGRLESLAAGNRPRHDTD